MKNALIRLHIAVILWGFTGVLGQAITLDSTMLVWWRLLITTVSLWLLYALRGRLTLLPMRAILRIGGIGTLLALHWVCFYASIKLANVTIALTCLSTAALFSSVVEPLLLRRKFDPVEGVLGLFAIAGIFIIYRTNLHYSAGIAVGLLASIFTVLVSVLNKKIVDDYPGEQLALYQLSGGFVGLTLLLPLFHYFFGEAWRSPTPWDWGWLLVLSWVCTIFTYFLYIRALKKVSAFTLNLTLTLEPVYGILLAFAIYHENKDLSPWFYPGFGLIALAVVFHMAHLVRTSRENRRSNEAIP